MICTNLRKVRLARPIEDITLRWIMSRCSVHYGTWVQLVTRPFSSQESGSAGLYAGIQWFECGRACTKLKDKSVSGKLEGVVLVGIMTYQGDIHLDICTNP